MKTLLFLLFGTYLSSSCSYAQTRFQTLGPKREIAYAQGTVNGGGGVGLLCGNHLEMLDLYEAKQRGWALLPAPASLEGAVSFLSGRLAHHFRNPDTIPEDEQSQVLAEKVIGPLLSGRTFLNMQTGALENVQFVESLPLSSDLGQYQLPPGCQLQQVAYFSDPTTNLSIVKSAWDKLDWLSKTVLVAHEFIYMIDRREGLETLDPNSPQMTSENARKFVGQIFSQISLASTMEGVPSNEEILKCYGSGSYFYAFSNPNTRALSLVFNVIRNAMSLYELRSDFALTKFEDAPLSKPSPEEEAPLDEVSRGQSSHFSIRLRKTRELNYEMKVFFNGNGRPQELGTVEKISCQPF